MMITLLTIYIIIYMDIYIYMILRIDILSIPKYMDVYGGTMNRMGHYYNLYI
jgi:hypothetical protein